MYSMHYKNVAPYCHWYSDICVLKSHIEERGKEITEKYSRQIDDYHTKLREAYKEGDEFGMIYEQHDDPTLDIRLKQNSEFISLEGEIKSTLEKTLKNIIEYFNLSSKQKENCSCLCSYMSEIEERKKIDMSEFVQKKNDLSILNINRNKSEHELDNSLREINQTYIQHQVNSAYLYMDALIQKLYDNE